MSICASASGGSSMTKTSALKSAKSFVSGKLSNMATVLMRIKRTKGIPVAGSKAREIMDILKMLDRAESVNSVRGYEGKRLSPLFRSLPERIR
ncbi:MAG: CRISPR-associated endonuclease Cas1 [Desulfomonilia bacterium]